MKKEASRQWEETKFQFEVGYQCGDKIRVGYVDHLVHYFTRDGDEEQDLVNAKKQHLQEFMDNLAHNSCVKLKTDGNIFFVNTKYIVYCKLL